MAGKIIADQIEHSTAGSLDTSYVVNGSAKAWVNYDATAITDPASLTGVLDSFNTASILDGGTGFSTIAFTNVFNNTYHVLSSSCNVALNAGNSRLLTPIQALSASQVQTRAALSSTLAAADCKSVQCALHGQLA